jgi:hypothetical protein
VVLIDMQIAFGAHGEIECRVPCQELEHVIEEPNSGLDARLAGAIDVELELDLGFVGLALDVCGARHVFA